jgi:hypothetical protein
MNEKSIKHIHKLFMNESNIIRTSYIEREANNEIFLRCTFVSVDYTNFDFTNTLFDKCVLINCIFINDCSKYMSECTIIGFDC